MLGSMYSFVFASVLVVTLATSAVAHAQAPRQAAGKGALKPGATQLSIVQVNAKDSQQKPIPLVTGEAAVQVQPRYASALRDITTQSEGNLPAAPCSLVTCVSARSVESSESPAASPARTGARLT